MTEFESKIDALLLQLGGGAVNPDVRLDHRTAITDLVDVRIGEVLDRLEEATPKREDFDDYNGGFLMAMYKNTIGKAIEEERSKLKDKR
ncbi:hypothetical protein [Glutamicibacter arilaitensis]|uniref:hypothetical protein n=1 Tax=Glutamicibacter arilaitensis TaxID=256701 RepID=UPI003FD36937